MTFDDDYMRFVFEHGRKDVSCKAAGVSWPPPETVEVLGFRMRLRRRSEITDEQRAGLTRVCRGAEYVVDVVQRDQTAIR
jgi:hypothetical protein